MFTILFEDQYLIAIDKPPGLPTQPTVDKSRPSALSLLEKQLPQTKIYLHHRLDRDTTGVLLFSKSSAANKPLTEMFKNHAFEKTYLMWTKKSANPPETKAWTIDNFLAPVKKGSRIERMVVVKSGGWHALTHFEWLEESSFGYLIKAQPKTGRTHQIRVHTALSKRPILGDFLYGGKSSEVPRMMLHAASLEFSHPITGISMKIESPLPKDFRRSSSRAE